MVAAVKAAAMVAALEVGMAVARNAAGDAAIAVMLMLLTKMLAHGWCQEN